jgi:hypothetical protein
MNWYEVQNYYSIEISENNTVRTKPYSIYKGRRLFQRKSRLKKVSRYNEIFIRENGLSNMVRVDRLTRGKLLS